MDNKDYFLAQAIDQTGSSSSLLDTLDEAIKTLADMNNRFMEISTSTHDIQAEVATGDCADDCMEAMLELKALVDTVRIYQAHYK